MNRTNIYLSDAQREQLDQRARAEGISRAELIRQLLDGALNDSGDSLEVDLAAINDSFGSLGGGALSVDRRDGARGAHLEQISGRARR